MAAEVQSDERAVAYLVVGVAGSVLLLGFLFKLVGQLSLGPQGSVALEALEATGAGLSLWPMRGLLLWQRRDSLKQHPVWLLTAVMAAVMLAPMLAMLRR